MADVVRLAFTNNKTAESVIAFISCGDCQNKTFRLIHLNDDFPRCECAACGRTVGKIGWVEDE
jgi:hypothetical protein